MSFLATRQMVEPFDKQDSYHHIDYSFIYSTVVPTMGAAMLPEGLLPTKGVGRRGVLPCSNSFVVV